MNPATNAFTRWAAGLRWPWLFLIAAVLLVIDLIVPDMIPLLDELLLGLATLLFAAWKRRKDPAAPPVMDADADPAETAKRVN
jgi:hypothetical protein